MKTHLLVLTFSLAATLPLAAQTPSHATVHHHTATAEHRTEGGCVTLPEISPKIPALPAGAHCARALYTLTRTPDLRLDYASPLVSPEVRESLSTGPTTFSLDYVDTEVGSGPLVEPHKWLTVHYTGYLVNGTKFDSSLDRGQPISFPYGQHRVIQGWDTGFEGMHIGGKRRLYVPYELAYGEAGRPPVIPAKAELVFDVELIGQSDQEPKPEPRTTAAPRPEPRPEPQGSAAKPGTTPATGGMERQGTRPGNPAAAPATTTKPNTPINTTTPNATPPTPKL